MMSERVARTHRWLMVSALISAITRLLPLHLRLLFESLKNSLISILHESERLRIVLLLLVADTLISFLLSAHSLHHVDKIPGHHISLLFLCSEWALGTLQALLLVLLNTLSFFWILTHRTLICVAEENTLLFGWYIRRLLHHLTFLLDQDARDSFIYPLSRFSLVVLILRVLKAEQLLTHHCEVAMGLFKLVLLLLTTNNEILKSMSQK